MSTMGSGVCAVLIHDFWNFPRYSPCRTVGRGGGICDRIRFMITAEYVMRNEDQKEIDPSHSIPSDAIQNRKLLSTINNSLHSTSKA
jgi:hypothetical protein